jgi:RNA polymerase sigma factor (sigma-70 family)
MIKNKKELEQLVKDYKINKSDTTFNQIYKILLPIVKRKTTYIYYKKLYHYNLYNPCSECKRCMKLNKVPKSEYNMTCKECEICTCNPLERGFFNLYEQGLCRWEEVFNDLWIRVTKIIDNYDINKPFITYLIATLWEWRPSFLTKKFIKSITTNKPLTYINDDGDTDEEEISGEEGQEMNTNVIDESSEEKSRPVLQDIFKECKTENEVKICKFYLENQNITEEELGQKLKMTKQNISLILHRLRKRLKKYLTK